LRSVTLGLYGSTVQHQSAAPLDACKNCFENEEHVALSTSGESFRFLKTGKIAIVTSENFAGQEPSDQHLCGQEGIMHGRIIT